ncbi:hypothetical protein F5Y03DRAFT_2870 [Xylaria venustula]|nr:hypothetical protein F5Y03DRAFT_2870 [Xylaria venustula]
MYQHKMKRALEMIETNKEVERALDEIFGPERHESTTRVENQETAAPEARKGEEGKMTTAPERNVNFAKNQPCRRDSGKRAARKTARSRGASQVRNQEAPSKKSDKASNSELCAEAATNDNNNGDDDDGYIDVEPEGDNDVAFECHPLQDYPHLDETTFLWKMNVRRPARPCKSLLRKQLGRIDTMLVKDPDFGAEVQEGLKDQEAVSQRVIQRLQPLELEGKKTAIPIYMGEGPADRWDFEPTATF